MRASRTSAVRPRLTVWAGFFMRRTSPVCAGVAQLVRASACHAEGRGFEPRHSRHFLLHLDRMLHIVYATFMASNTQTLTRATNLRIKDDVRAVIDRAARLRGKTRSEFMIEASRRAAEETLLDETLVRVDAKTYARFVEVLDQPPANEGFARLMSAKQPWRA